MKRLLPLLLLAACAAPEEIGTTSSPIVAGTDADATEDAVVLVMHYETLAAGGAAASGCTGTLLAPRLVLTARHCVATTDESAVCNSDGEAIQGGRVTGERAADAMYVFSGRTRPDFLNGKARPVRGQEILTTGASTICNADIALILLASPLTGVPIAPVRLTDNAFKNERITVAGWGISEKTENPGTLQQRAGVHVVDVGPGNGLGSTEFETGEGTCNGDSGGPALAATGAVIGVLSRGGNGTAGQGITGCLNAKNIYTSVPANADFLRSGYAKAGQEPWLENGPNPLTSAEKPDATDGCTATHRSSSYSALSLFALAVLLRRLRSRK